MNWIKVTSDTVVPTDVDVLIKASTMGNILKGRIIPETNSIFEVDHSETTYLKAEYSHYCLITQPKSYSTYDLVKARLEDAEHELGKWDGRKEITYNDTSFNAASVNYGKIESLEYVLDLLKR